MASLDQVSHEFDSTTISVLGENSLVFDSTLDAQLLINLGREGRHEGLKNGRQHVNCVQSVTNDLITADLVTLELLPRLHSLEIPVAFLGEFHSDLETVFQLQCIHSLEVASRVLTQAFKECGVFLVASSGGDLAIILLRVGCEGEDTMDHVSEIGKQFVVVLGDEIRPKEDGVLVLRSVDQQVVAPNFNIDTGFHSMVAKHTCVCRFGEFAGLNFTILIRKIFVVKVLSRRNTVKEGPWLLSSQHGAWEHNGVESQVVFAHELDKFDVFGVHPPLFPLVSVVGSDRDIANWRVKPHIENFVGVLFKWDGRTPFQVSGDGSGKETLLHQRGRELDRIG